MGLSAGVEKIGLQAVLEDKDFQRGLATYIKGVDKATSQTERAADKISKDTKKIGKSWQESGQMVAVVSAAMGAAMVALLTKITLTAARTQELGIVLTSVGRNIGKTADDMAEFEAGVKSMGITTQAARQSLIQMAQANIDLAHATDLARLAQDAAVIAGLDSSQAFQTLITGIQRGSLIVLRTMGLTVSWENAYKDFAKTLGKTQSELTLQEKLTARIGEVMRAGANIAGTYEAAMGSAGKQMRSMARYTEELQNELGEHLLPVMGAAVSGTTDFLKVMLGLPTPVKATIVQVGALAAAVTILGSAAILAAPQIGLLTAALASLALPVTMIAGITAAVIYVKELEKAHKEEAAQVLETSGAYRDYVAELDRAGLNAHTLTEELYDLAKAVDGSAQAMRALELEDAADSLEDFVMMTRSAVPGIGGISESLRNLIPLLTTTELEVLKNSSALADWLIQLGLEEDAAISLAAELKELGDQYFYLRRAQGLILDETEKYNRMNRDLSKSLGSAAEQVTVLTAKEKSVIRATEKTIQAMKDLARETGMTYVEVRRLNDEGWTGDEIRAYTDDLEITGFEFYKLSQQLGYSVADLKSVHLEFGGGEQVIKDWAKGIEESEKAWNDAVSAWIDGVVQLGNIKKRLQGVRKAFNTTIAGINKDLADSVAGIRAKYDSMLPDRTSDQARLDAATESWDEWARRIEAFFDGIEGPQELGWVEDIKGMVEGTEFMQKEGEGNLEYYTWLLDQFMQRKLPDEFYFMDTAAWQRSSDEWTAAMEEDISDAETLAGAARAAAEEIRKVQRRTLVRERKQVRFGVGLEIAEGGPDLKAWAEEHLGALAEFGDTAAEASKLYFSGLLNKMPEAKAALEKLAEVDLSTNLEDAVRAVGELTNELAPVEEEAKNTGDGFEIMARKAGDAEKDIEKDSKDLEKEMKRSWDAIREHALEQIQKIQQKYNEIKSKTITITVVWDDGGGGGGEEPIQEGWEWYTDEQGRRLSRPIGSQQRGGPVSAGRTYIVGEAGPELFVPEQSGTIVPNDSLSYWAQWVATAMSARSWPEAKRKGKGMTEEERASKWLDNMMERLTNMVGLAEDFADVWEEQMIPSAIKLGDELAGIGSSFASMLEDQAEGLSILQGSSAEWERINKAVMDFRGAEQRLSYLQDQQDLIDAVIAAGLDARDVFADVTFGAEADTAQLLQLVADHMRDAADAQGDLITDTDAYIAQREKLYRIEQASLELDFLQTQLDLMGALERLGDELGDNLRTILDGMQFGLDADAGALVAFMDELIQAMLAQTKSSLGAFSHSRKYEALGREISRGMEIGIMAEAHRPLAATTYITNVSSPISFGDTTISTEADWASFQGRVVDIVKRSATGRI